jgi:hypothetical protein
VNATDILGRTLTAAAIAARLGETLRDRDPFAALSWRDPLAAGWNPATTSPATTWAAAWDELGLAWPVRFALDIGPDGPTPDWLAETLGGPGVHADSSFVALHGGTAGRRGVGRGLVGRDLDRPRSLLQRPGEEPARRRRVPLVGGQHVDDLAKLVDRPV